MQDKIMELIEEFEERLQEVKDKYAKLNHGFKNGDYYWYIDCDGGLRNERWDSEYDHNVFVIGNAFKTKEEAEFMMEKLKVLHELSRFTRPFEPLSENWCIYINGHGQIDYYSEDESQYLYGDYYFNSKEEAIRAVEQIGEDRIHEYLFN